MMNTVPENVRHSITREDDMLCTMCMLGVSDNETWECVYCGSESRNCRHVLDCPACGKRKHLYPENLAKFFPPFEMALETIAEKVFEDDENIRSVGGGAVIVISRRAWDNILAMRNRYETICGT